jgi:hypothetical protein
MNNVINHYKRPGRNITWPEPPQPTSCVHQYEVITHEVGDALKRCFKCGSLEAE